MNTNIQRQMPDEYVNAVKNGKRRAYLENQLYTIYQSQRLHDRYQQLKQELPTPWSIKVLLGIVAFLFLDALLTLSILGSSSSPGLGIGQILVHKDIAIFFVIKSLITAVFLGLLAVHKHYEFSKGISGKQLLVGSVFVYSTLQSCLAVIVGSF